MNNKRRMKWIARVMALALTGTLMLGGAAAVKPVTAYAAESSIIDGQTTTGSLTITKHGATQAKNLPGAEFSVYKVMNLSETEGNFTYTPVNAFKDDLDGVIVDDLGNYSAAEIEALASQLRDTALDKTSPVPVTAKAETNDNGIVTFSDLALGYYLVVETKAPDTYVAGSPFLVAIPSTDNYADKDSAGTKWVYEVQVEAKNAQVYIDKALAGDEPGAEQDGTVAVGDYVKYVVTTTIPEYTAEYTNALFRIKDVMSDGLAIQKDTAYPVVVKVNNKEEAEDTNTYTVQAVPTTGDDPDLVITFAPAYVLSHKGESVEVTYYALITNQAVTGTAGNPNKVTLDYNSDPSTEAEAGPAEVKVYSFNIQIEKFTKEGGVQGLEGAEFGLYSDEECKNLVANTMVSPTNDKGILKFERLDADTYYLKEIKSPTGYTLLTNPIKVEIKAGENGNFELYVDGTKIPSENTFQFTTRYNVSEGTAYVAVENHKGFSLPSTGGAGIALFLIVGAAGIVLVSVAFTRKSRKAN